MDRVQPRHGFGPADRVTLVRAVLALVVAGLVVRGFVGASQVSLLVALASVGLVLDAVDGWVARRTGTASAFGARFDMEVDAFLIAVLSVQVAPDHGWWVLAIGAMRYAYVVVGWSLTWLRRPTPPRYDAKVIAAVQGIVLVVAASGLLPDGLVSAALLVALALLTYSFGRDVRWQWRHRREAPVPERPAGVSVGVTVAAFVGLWLAFAPPGGTFPAIPVEGLVLVAVALLAPLAPRARPVVAVVAVAVGLAAAAGVVLRMLDGGFRFVADRPFHVLGDWSYLGKGVGVLRDTVGDVTGVLLAVGLVLVVAALVVLLPWAALRVTRVAADHPRSAARTVVVLTVAWLMAAVAGGPVTRVAGSSTVGLATETVGQIRADLRDRTAFADAIADDRFADVPADRLLAGLHGRDVLVVWVESYGRVAVEGTSYAKGIRAVLRDGTRRLDRAGYAMRSAFLTSPTFGAASWLAHGTLQSGVWTDTEQRYGQLLASDRMTLTSAFDRAGWRTVFTVPANTRDWPEGAAFYGFDDLYDSRNVGYAGPEFGYASMPDQYTLDHLRRTELTSGERPSVMVEVDLVSSHHPWAPLPESVPWREVGDGSVFDGMPERGERAVDGVEHPEQAQRRYGDSIVYTWRTLVSFLLTYPDPDRVVVIAGDHQPHSFVSGDDPGHDVPVTVLSQDPAVLHPIADWRWQPGLLPAPDAPVWSMAAFRDRWFAAYAAR